MATLGGGSSSRGRGGVRLFSPPLCPRHVWLRHSLTSTLWRPPGSGARTPCSPAVLRRRLPRPAWQSGGRRGRSASCPSGRSSDWRTGRPEGRRVGREEEKSQSVVGTIDYPEVHFGGLSWLMTHHHHHHLIWHKWKVCRRQLSSDALSNLVKNGHIFVILYAKKITQLLIQTWQKKTVLIQSNPVKWNPKSPLKLDNFWREQLLRSCSTILFEQFENHPGYVSPVVT